ncbi:hypothetical protein ACFQV8_03860 [Pseudonocardia benzenivorans]
MADEPSNRGRAGRRRSARGPGGESAARGAAPALRPPRRGRRRRLRRSRRRARRRCSRAPPPRRPPRPRTSVVDIHGDLERDGRAEIDGDIDGDVPGDIEEAAGSSTVVDLVTDETPALVPSVLAGIGRVGRQVHHVVHAMVVVRRDPDGRLRAVDAAADPDDPPAGALVEAWIRLGLDPAAPEEGEDLGAELDEVLAAVHDVAADVARLADTVLAVAAELSGATELSGANASTERDDAARLLHWLADGHFSFLGYRRYEAVGTTLRAVPGSGLGVLRHNGVRDGIPDVVGDRPLVVLTRADAPSRVLRPEYPYDVVIGIVDEHGHTVGGTGSSGCSQPRPCTSTSWTPRSSSGGCAPRSIGRECRSSPGAASSCSTCCRAARARSCSGRASRPCTRPPSGC